MLTASELEQRHIKKFNKFVDTMIKTGEIHDPVKWEDLSDRQRIHFREVNMTTCLARKKGKKIIKAVSEVKW